MGLFGEKERCPICGQVVKGVFKVKIKDKVALCQECGSKTDMDLEMMPFQSEDDIKEHLVSRERNLIEFNSFTISREIKTQFYFFRVDDSKKMWYCSVMKNPVNPALYRYDEIVNYELIENGDNLQGGIGKPVVKLMQLRISLNNKYHTSVVMNFVPIGTKCDKGGFIYKTYMQQANTLISLLDSMCSQAQQNSTIQINTVQSVSGADEIVKYKGLFDQGIISQEEFDTKKRQILGL